MEDNPYQPPKNPEKSLPSSSPAIIWNRRTILNLLAGLLMGGILAWALIWTLETYVTPYVTPYFSPARQ